MRERDLDHSLTELFHQGLALTEAEQAALWRRFTARQSHDAQSWAAFRVAMVHLRRMLRTAMRYSPERTVWQALGTDIDPSTDRVTLFGFMHT
jgi:hypothetical protein